MGRTRIAVLLVLSLAWSTCGNKGNSGVTAVLPGNKEIGIWRIFEGPIAAKTDGDLYNRIDGGAPKYMDRGWVSSVYATYRRDGYSTEIYVSVHDMGTPENAEGIFNAYLPAARTEVSYAERDLGGRRPNAVVDLNLPSAYSACGFSKRYYLEANIDAKTDIALADLKTFMLEMIDHAQ